MHEQVAVRAAVAGHQVVEVGRRRGRSPAQAPLLQMLLGHWRGGGKGSLTVITRGHMVHLRSAGLSPLAAAIMDRAGLPCTERR